MRKHETRVSKGELFLFTVSIREKANGVATVEQKRKHELAKDNYFGQHIDREKIKGHALMNERVPPRVSQGQPISLLLTLQKIQGGKHSRMKMRIVS